MITKLGTSNNIISTQGKFQSVSVGFISDETLLETILRFSPAIYCDPSVSASPNSKAWELPYPNIAGFYPMTYNGINPSGENHSANLEVIDDFRFVIRYDFVVVPDQGGFLGETFSNNAIFFDTSTLYAANICFAVSAGSSKASENVPFTFNPWCAEEVNFSFKVDDIDRDGYEVGKDLKITIEIPQGAHNEYFFGFCASSNIDNNSGIVEDRDLNYASVNDFIVAQVSDANSDPLPFSCFTGVGRGFISNVGEPSDAYIVIDSACFDYNECYLFYVVYRNNDSEWNSCYSEVCEGTPYNPCVVGDVVVEVTDAFGDSAFADIISGLSSCLPVDVSISMDKTSYNNALTALGLTGTFDGNFQSFNSSAVGLYDETTALFETNVNPNGSNGVIQIFANWVFLVDGLEQIVTKVVTLKFNAIVIEFEPFIKNLEGDIQKICLEMPEIIRGEHPILTGNMAIFSNLNGGAYQQDGLVNNLIELNTADISVGDVVCVKVVKSGSIPDDCPPCPIGLQVGLTQDSCTPTQVTVYVDADDGNGSISSVTIDYEINEVIDTIELPVTSASFNVNIIEAANITGTYLIKATGANGCQYEVLTGAISTLGQGAPNSGCISQNQYTFNTLTPLEDCTTGLLSGSGNFNEFDLSYVYDEIAGTVTVSLQDVFVSPIDNDEFMCSINNGTPIACPPVITVLGEVRIWRLVTFTDGADSLYAEQYVYAQPNNLCLNSRVLTGTIVFNNGQFFLRINTNSDVFGSPVLLDYLTIWVNDILVYHGLRTNYLDDHEIFSGDELTFQTVTAFDDDCPDYDTGIIYKLFPTETPNCDYSGFILGCSFDEITGEFTATFTGDENLLVTNEKKFCLDNNKEMEYTKPVGLGGFFAVSWTIQRPNCEPVTLTDYCYGCSPCIGTGSGTSNTVFCSQQWSGVISVGNAFLELIDGTNVGDVGGYTGANALPMANDAKTYLEGLGHTVGTASGGQNGNGWVNFINLSNTNAPANILRVRWATSAQTNPVFVALSNCT